ncbi:MAG: glucosidase [Granulosicoccus sp.]
MAAFRIPTNAERRRLRAHARKQANWKLWGPYLAERAWGTVREDYSSDGNAWAYFPHDHAASRAYRWNEDGLGGFCDRNQYLCCGLALWNGKDPILKERLFGLSGPEGNHGEDVKEHYWYEDSTPTHSYASMRYHYPQDEFPYALLRKENAARHYKDNEFELSDTGVFSNDRYFDLQIVYAKAAEDDLLIHVHIHNRSDKRASLTVIPQVWFRNTWSWGYANGPMGDQTSMPLLQQAESNVIHASHSALGDYYFHWQGKAELMMTNNDTNRRLLFNKDNHTPYVKDAFHRYIVNHEKEAINPDLRGTKAGVRYALSLAPASSRTLQLRLSRHRQSRPFLGFRPTVNKRRSEADNFYRSIQSSALNDDSRLIQRQALAGMLWSKQLYYYDITQWHKGDPKLPVVRNNERNVHWQHMHNFDIMSMPDKWEYPWYAVWDTAFHTLPLAMLDAEYAKRQLILITRERFMHPDGQLPAYEWAYNDVNPPVHAWATLRVYHLDEQQNQKADRAFLETVFHKLLLNFTWWVNRKDSQGNSLFEGGFLGLDNISLFDRSKTPPTGGILNQADGTAWMGFFSQCMLNTALLLAEENPVYQSMASKLVEHYLRIGHAISGNSERRGLWNEADSFFYDRLDLPDGTQIPLRVRSLVGLMPLIAASTIDENTFEKFPEFAMRLKWILKHQRDSVRGLETRNGTDGSSKFLLTFLNESQLRAVLAYMLDENEFLSPFGIRSLSRFHAEHPFSWQSRNGETLSIGYEPGEGETDLFGGNSNWRGPVWFPINYLIVESMRSYDAFYGDTFSVECPTGSGNMMTLAQVADFLSRRLISLFEPDERGKRPWCGNNSDLQKAADEGLHLFFEYFHADTGEGLGASHQTGWTGLLAMLQQQCGTSG